MISKTIIITGAGGGIGFAIVRGLIHTAPHYFVLGIDVNTQQLETLQKLYPSQLLAITGDVRDRSVSATAVEKAISRTGRIDTLVLNAGILNPVGSISDTSVADWERNFAVNFFSLLHTIQLAWSYLIDAGGQIIMTSSGVALQPSMGWAPYGCSKSTMNYLAACIPLEEPRLSALSITPGIVDTGIQAKARGEEKLTTSMREWLQNLHDENQLLRPEQPAAAFVRVITKGIPSSMSGKVISWDRILEELDDLQLDKIPPLEATI